MPATKVLLLWKSPGGDTAVEESFLRCCCCVGPAPPSRRELSEACVDELTEDVLCAMTTLVEEVPVRVVMEVEGTMGATDWEMNW